MYVVTFVSVCECVYTKCNTEYTHLVYLALMLFSPFIRLDALALSVIATATWLAGWLGGWLGVSHSRYCIKTTKPIGKLLGPSGRPII